MGMITIQYNKQNKVLKAGLTCVLCAHQWELRFTGTKAQFYRKWEECPNCGATVELIHPDQEKSPITYLKKGRHD